jgi:hypothetical protein
MKKAIVFLATALSSCTALLFCNFSERTVTGKTSAGFHGFQKKAPGIIYVSPIPAIGVGPNGLPTKKITVAPYCCPSDAIEITGMGPVGENDFQWVNIPLELPAGRIKGVRVCYGTKNKAYISQTRLSAMTTPDKALVVLDDPANQASAVPTCYNTVANVIVDATITLSLKVVIPAGGSITIGSIEIDML